MPDPLRIGVLGIDHGHIFGMLRHVMAEGAEPVAWWTGGPAVTETKFRETFPDLQRAETADAILNDPRIDLVLIAAIPRDRADLAIRAMKMAMETSLCRGFHSGCH